MVQCPPGSWALPSISLCRPAGARERGPYERCTAIAVTVEAAERHQPKEAAAGRSGRTQHDQVDMIRARKLEQRIGGIHRLDDVRARAGAGAQRLHPAPTRDACPSRVERSHTFSARNGGARITETHISRSGLSDTMPAGRPFERSSGCSVSTAANHRPGARPPAAAGARRHRATHATIAAVVERHRAPRSARRVPTTRMASIAEPQCDVRQPIGSAAMHRRARSTPTPSSGIFWPATASCG